MMMLKGRLDGAARTIAAFGFRAIAMMMKGRHGGAARTNVAY